MEGAFIAGTIVALIFSIFFAGIEVAFLSVTRNPPSDQVLTTVTVPQKIMTFFARRPTWLIGTTLIGNIASLLLFGICATLMLVSWYQLNFSPLSISALLPIAVITAVLAIIMLYTVEFFSKSFFIINSRKVLRILAIPFAVIFIVLFPVVFIVISLARFIINNVFGLEYSKERPVFGLTDVNQYLKSLRRVKSTNDDLELDRKIFRNALEFKTVRVRDCMIPRTEIVAVPLDSDLERLYKAFLESGHSKIIVYKESIDDIVGYCHSSALFKKPSRIDEILTPIITVPETMLARELMVRLINDRKSLAAVVDEFGGTAGIVSIEDVIEEIFGEIEDEHDEDTEIELQLDERSWLLSARLEVDYLNETYKWELPTGDYDTLGGLILSFTEDLPKKGETIRVAPYVFTVQDTEENRIKTLRMVIEPTDESSDNQ